MDEMPTRTEVTIPLGKKKLHEVYNISRIPLHELNKQITKQRYLFIS